MARNPAPINQSLNGPGCTCSPGTRMSQRGDSKVNTPLSRTKVTTDVATPSRTPDTRTLAPPAVLSAVPGMVKERMAGDSGVASAGDVGTCDTGGGWCKRKRGRRGGVGANGSKGGGGGGGGRVEHGRQGPHTSNGEMYSTCPQAGRDRTRGPRTPPRLSQAAKKA
jgi:hypothetical protein